MNKQKFNRILLIDECLQNKNHISGNNPEYAGCWSKDDLLDKIFDRLDQEITGRTLRSDIEYLRDQKGAPIVTLRSIGYYYDDKPSDRYAFNLNPLTTDDIKKLKNVIEVLKQFGSLTYFDEAAVIINKLEDKVESHTPSIYFDINDRLKGLNHMDILANSIREKKTIVLEYKPFNTDTVEKDTISAYQLREYNNRWFILAKTREKKENEIGVYALDRIIDVKYSDKKYQKTPIEQIRNYFNNIIGVTNYKDNKVEKIIIKIYGIRAEYVKTKPWHHSMEILKEDDNETTFRLDLKINPELEAQILSFGKDIIVLEPVELKDLIANKLQLGADLYRL